MSDVIRAFAFALCAVTCVVGFAFAGAFCVYHCGTYLGWPDTLAELLSILGFTFGGVAGGAAFVEATDA